WRGPGRPMVLAAAAVYLLAFQEFELASLLLTTTWTVRLFDLQVGGMPLARTLPQVVLPVLCELLVLLPIIWALRYRADAQAERDRQTVMPRPAGRWLARGYLAIACWCTLAWPVWIIARESVQAPGVMAQLSTMREALAT